MELCVIAVDSNRFMEYDGSVQIVEITIYAVCAIMEKNMCYDIVSPELQLPVVKGESFKLNVNACIMCVDECERESESNAVSESYLFSELYWIHDAKARK